MTAARDPREVFREAVEFARQGRYEDALQNHLWFHEHALDHDTALGGVRLSFALASWVELGERYPPALEALTSIRDEKAQAVTAGRGSFPLFHDVAAINGYLQEAGRTVELFKVMHQEYPELARQCYGVAEGNLVAAREYEVCSSYLPDALARFEEIRQLFKLKLEIADENPRLRAGGIREYAEMSFAAEVGRLIEILVGVGRRQEAERMGELALGVSAGAGVRDAVEKALRSEDPGP
jgi:hypothetical protein